MFIHNLKYALKTLFKNKALIFWTFAFPIILGTLFQMAFHDIENSEKLSTINIAIVENDMWNQNPAYKSIFEQLENGEEKMFSITYSTENVAKEKLEQKEISGYLIFDDNLKVVVQENGINATILKYVTEEIIQTEDIITKAINQKMSEVDPSTITADFYQKISTEINQIKQQDVKLTDISSYHLSYTLIEFYTLIAMTCLYGGILGMHAINQNLANQSASGKRIAVGPTKKMHIILSSALAGYIVQLIGIALLFLYTIFILKINYGDQILPIIILTLIGCLAGLSMGIMIASVLKTNENTKTGIVITITMLGCFLSGMMGITMKYMIDKNIPLLNLINPASMITDGFYALYYYETMDRYYFNIVSLIIFSAIMLILSIRSLRRQKYDSI